MRFQIAQCLCGPNRHAIMAMPYKGDDLTDEQVRGLIQLAVEMMVAGRGAELDAGLPAKVNPWCGLCGAPAHDWQYEVQRSIEFPDWETALQVLREQEAAQHATRALLNLIDLAYDARRPHAIAADKDDDGNKRRD